jgi:hypothetical protein
MKQASQIFLLPFFPPCNLQPYDEFPTISRRCWGLNDAGQLGIGHNNNVDLQPQPVSFLMRDAIKVIAGAQ